MKPSAFLPGDNFTGDNGFHILLQHSASVIRPHAIQDRTNSLNGTDQGRSQDFSKGGAEVMEAKAL